MIVSPPTEPRSCHMNNKPRKKRPNMEIWSEQPMQGAKCYQDLVDFVNSINPENVDSFYCLVNKKPMAKVKGGKNG